MLIMLFIISVLIINKSYLNREKLSNEVFVTLQSHHTNEYVLYYDTGEGFTEQKSVRIMSKSSEGKANLKFALPAKENILNLRFDLGVKPGVDIVIYSIKYKNKSLLGYLKSSNMVETEQNKSSLKIKTTGIDPYLHLSEVNKDMTGGISSGEIMLYMLSFLISVIIVWLVTYLELLEYKQAQTHSNVAVVQSILLIFIFVPVLTTIFFPSKTVTTENRVLAAKPTTSITDYKKFTKEFESYFNDHFGLRNELVKLNSNIKYHIFGKSANPNVVIGKNGWQFYSAEKSIEDYQGLVRFSDAELEKITSNLEKAKNAAEGVGAEFIFMVGPNKQTIYPEYIPNKYVRFKNETRYDQLLDYLRAHSKIKFVDVRDTLIQSKVDFQTYYATDTHWNDFGGYLAYQKLLNSLSNYHPHSREDFNISTVTYRMQLDLAIMLSMKLDDTLVSLVPKFKRTSKVIKSDNYLTSYVNESESRQLLMYRDSFGAAMIPYLADHFKNSTFLTDYKVSQSRITEEKPSVVVLEIVERNLPLLLY